MAASLQSLSIVLAVADAGGHSGVGTAAGVVVAVRWARAPLHTDAGAVLPALAAAAAVHHVVSRTAAAAAAACAAATILSMHSSDLGDYGSCRGRLTDKQTDRLTSRQTDRQTDR